MRKPIEMENYSKWLSRLCNCYAKVYLYLITLVNEKNIWVYMYKWIHKNNVYKAKIYQNVLKYLIMSFKIRDNSSPPRANIYLKCLMFSSVKCSLLTLAQKWNTNTGLPGNSFVDCFAPTFCTLEIKEFQNGNTLAHGNSFLKMPFKMQYKCYFNTCHCAQP